jgi:hypothetical protein
VSATESASGLVTSAPEITAPPPFWPTGNLWVSLPEIDLTDGSVASAGVLLERAAGLVQAHGGPGGLLRPAVEIDGEPVPIQPRWSRDGDWVPHLRQQAGGVAIDAWYLAPHGERGAAFRLRLRNGGPAARLVTAGPHGPMWAWACDDAGRHEIRDEPPLGLRTLPYWGLCEENDPVQVATRRWLADGYRHHYPGAFPGAGAPHFPHPSGFDLANRLLDGDDSLGDPLAALAAAPMDQGLACESWDPDTGVVRTGAAMASMAGLLAWTAWARLTGHRRWDQPIRR